MMFSIDVDQNNFAEVVLSGSQLVPVLVDFWAPWCAPCRGLKPILEKLAAEYAGRFVLAKINSDENSALAQRYGVRGIPNVKAFLQGEIVDEFSGAQTEAEVRAFIDRLLPSPAEIFRQQAAEALAAGDEATALQRLSQASAADPANEAVRIDAASLLLQRGQIDEARQLLDSLSETARSGEAARAVLARLQFAGGADAGALAALEATVAADPRDLEARLQLANACLAAHDYEAGMEQLLEIIARDRSFGDDVGRKTLLTVFEMLGDHELVGRYRRRLASALN